MAAASTVAIGVSAGLDVVSGVFGYLSSLNAASVARDRADMIRMEADANAQRYAERAQADRAQRKVMFLASGVTVSGSVIDELDNDARVASENLHAIRMGGATAAFDQEQQGENALVGGRNALLGGISAGAGAVAKGAYLNSIYSGMGKPAASDGSGYHDPDGGK